MLTRVERNSFRFKTPSGDEIFGARRHATELFGKFSFAGFVNGGKLGLHASKLSSAFTTAVDFLFTFGKAHVNLLSDSAIRRATHTFK